MRFPSFNLICISTSLLLTGCQRDAHSPTIDVLGSYFPAWIVCIVIGLGLSLTARQILIGLRLNDFLRPGPLIHFCLAILFILAAWFLLYRN
jgi:hypothetical protein